MGSLLVYTRQEEPVLHATEALHDFCVTRNTSTSGVCSVMLRDIRGYRSIVSLHLTATLLLHATLFLLKSTTIDVSHPALSIHKHYSKGNRYSSQYTGHRFCLSIRQHSTLVEGRIGVAGVFIRQDTGGIWRQMRAFQRSAQYFFAMGHGPATVNTKLL